VSDPRQRSAAAAWHADRLLPDALRLCAHSRLSGRSATWNEGGVHGGTPRADLPLLRGLLLGGLLRGLLRHFSSWSGGCSGLPTGMWFWLRVVWAIHPHTRC